MGGVNTTTQPKTAAASQNRDPFRTTFHRDGTITFWNVYQQRWQRQRASSMSDQDLASMSQKDRARTLRMGAMTTTQEAR
jgi:hypothetical protein